MILLSLRTYPVLFLTHMGYQQPKVTSLCVITEAMRLPARQWFWPLDLSNQEQHPARQSGVMEL